ncbi:MAG: hypothetical protein H0W70_03625 [Actinobacteria bacterium]|nr:hypothetical protein [Actinomycetota bacterium]
MGRAVAHASGSAVFAPVDPPPPPLSRTLEVMTQPAYATPDPPRRPLSATAAANLPAGDDPEVVPPMGELIGVDLLENDGRRSRLELPASLWFTRMDPTVSAGIIGAAGNVAVNSAIASVREGDERLVVLSSSMSFLATVPPDGRPMVATGKVRHRAEDLLVAESEVADADGRTVALSQGIAMLRPGNPRPGAARRVERVLLTVLFSDVVGSTERARQLGDDKWNELLAEHHALIRRKLAQFKGREVKTTGDGFLCTFESPTRAVECAQAIRDGVRRLGLELYVGIHTGECEVGGGDIAGLAVHVASRLEATAGPGEILVSSTVRDLIAGSGATLVDRGAHELKGLDGAWLLFAVE